MKKILFWLLILSPVIFGLVLTLYFLPHLIYYQTVNGILQTKWYVVQPTDHLYLTGKLFQFDRDYPTAKMATRIEKYWQNFHIANFRIPLPMYHPIYEVNPYIEAPTKTNVNLGMQYLTREQELLCSLVMHRPIKFRHVFTAQPLYEIPLVTSYLEQILGKSLWRDLFVNDLKFQMKKLTPAEIEAQAKAVDQSEYDADFERLMNLRANVRSVARFLGMSLADIVYNLYLWDLRKAFFPKKLSNFSYYEALNAGIIEIDTPELEKEYLVLFLRNGFIYSYTLKIHRNDGNAWDSGENILRTTEFVGSSKELSAKFYRDFTELPFNVKTGQEGMYYLYAAWSHDVENERFLQEVIRFLERGRGNLPRLQSLYEYAFNRYGSSFSARPEMKTAQERLQDKIQESEEAAYEQAKAQTVTPGEEGGLASEARARELLQQGPPEGERVGPEQSDSSITVE